MPRKKTVNTEKIKKDHQQNIIETALNLAAQKDWSSVTLHEIATRSGVDCADLRHHFSSKDAILDRFSDVIDTQLAEKIDPDIATAPVRERLFELLMARFDLLTGHKEALRSIMNSVPADPLSIAPGLMRLRHSMRWTLEIADISVSGMRGFLRVQFLSAAFLAALRVWLRDESPDMAMTMATIDRWINRAEELEKRFCPWATKQHESSYSLKTEQNSDASG